MPMNGLTTVTGPNGFDAETTNVSAAGRLKCIPARAPEYREAPILV